MADESILENISEKIKEVTGLHANEQLDISKAIFQRGFVESNLAEKHPFVTGVETDDPVMIIDDSVNYASFPFVDSADCAFNECAMDIKGFIKKWKMATYNCRIPICLKKLKSDFATYWRINRDLLHDYSDAQVFLDYLMGRFERNILGTAWRQSYFGDSTILDTDPNYKLLKGVDGFFIQAEAGAGKRIVLNQTSPSGKEIYEALQDAYDYMMEQPWSDREGKAWKMTRKMASAIVSWLNGMKDTSEYNCACLNADSIVGTRFFTIDNLMLFGIPVDVENDLDGVINQLKIERPYRALLTFRNNLQVGTASKGDISDFELWYDRKTRNIYMDGEIYMGAMLAEDSYVYIGAEVAN